MDQNNPVTTPKVSVIIPLYNTGEFIGETLRSICNQTLRDIEIIIVDDGSTDNGPAIVATAAAADPRIRTVSQANQGQSVARNAGIAMAGGEYIYFMDSDDLLELNALEMLSRKADGLETDFLFFDADILNPVNSYALSLNYQRTCHADPEKIYNGTAMLNLLLEKWGYSASPCLSFIRRSYLEKAELRFYPGIIHEDELFTSLLYLRASRVAAFPQTLFHRRLRDNSTMTRPFSMHNMKGYFTVASELSLLAGKSAPETRKVINRFLSLMLNAALQAAYRLPLRERFRLLQVSLSRHLALIEPRTVLILLLKNAIRRR